MARKRKRILYIENCNIVKLNGIYIQTDIEHFENESNKSIKIIKQESLPQFNIKKGGVWIIQETTKTTETVSFTHDTDVKTNNTSTKPNGDNKIPMTTIDWYINIECDSLYPFFPKSGSKSWIPIAGTDRTTKVQSNEKKISKKISKKKTSEK